MVTLGRGDLLKLLKIREQNEALRKENEVLRKENATLRDENETLREEIDELRYSLSEPQSEDSENEYFIASPRRRLFHLPSCSWTQWVGDPIEFTSHNEAVGRGYRPCKTCRA